MNKEFIAAIEQLEEEKEISKDLLIDTIESALVSAYKKNYAPNQNVKVVVDRQEGDISVYVYKIVVDDVYDPFTEIALEEVSKTNPELELDDLVETIVKPKDFGRIAAQTAKQVVVQRIREAERGMIFDDFSARQSEIVTGVVQRVTNDTVFLNMGKTEGILAVTEQVPGESYKIGAHLKVFIMDVKKTTKGPQVYLSRSHPGLVKRLFELEVPEIQDGIVEIKSIAREAGSRTKIAVFANEANIDAVGACVGTRGTRVQAVVDELFGEKIDIINWSNDPESLISSALSPAKVEKTIIDEEAKSAIVIVPDYQLSLAIGKEGQNVRLAAKLCGWKIDIKSHSQYAESQDSETLEDDNFNSEYETYYDDEMEQYYDSEEERPEIADSDENDYFDGEGYFENDDDIVLVDD